MKIKLQVLEQILISMHYHQLLLMKKLSLFCKKSWNNSSKLEKNLTKKSQIILIKTSKIENSSTNQSEKVTKWKKNPCRAKYKRRWRNILLLRNRKLLEMHRLKASTVFMFKNFIVRDNIRLNKRQLNLRNE